MGTTGTLTGKYFREYRYVSSTRWTEGAYEFGQTGEVLGAVGESHYLFSYDEHDGKPAVQKVEIVAALYGWRFFDTREALEADRT